MSCKKAHTMKPLESVRLKPDSMVNDSLELERSVAFSTEGYISGVVKGVLYDFSSNWREHA